MIQLFLIQSFQLPNLYADRRGAPPFSNRPVPGGRDGQNRGWPFPGGRHFRPGKPLQGNFGYTCPSQSISVSSSPDGSELAVLFSSFEAQAGGNTGKDLSIVQCNFDIPIDVPTGMTLGVYKVDYRGFNFLPDGSKSILQIVYNLRGLTFKPYEQIFNGLLNSDFLISQPFIAPSGNMLPPNNRDWGPRRERNENSDRQWSGCGQKVVIRTSAKLLVQSNASHELATTTIDSADAAPDGGMIYSLDWKKCNGP